VSCPFTIRSLLAAYKRRLRREWQATASILAMLHNVNCTDKSKLKSPSHFDIYGKGGKSNEQSMGEHIAATAPTFKRKEV
jgi:hypothetical protein